MTRRCGLDRTYRNFVKKCTKQLLSTCLLKTCQTPRQYEDILGYWQNNLVYSNSDRVELRDRMANFQSKATDWYINLKNQLGPDKMQVLLDQFSACSSDSDKVQLLYDLPEINNVIKVHARKTEKSAEKSIKFREEGNKIFQERKFKKALHFYNVSVAMAPSQDDQNLLALALANRSAALLYLKMYRLCLADVEAAFEHGYPQDLSYKLWEREGKCYYQMGKREQAICAFEKAIAGVEQSNLPNDKKPGVTEAIQKQLKQSEKLDESPVSNQADKEPKHHDPIPSVKGKPSQSVPALTNLATVGYNEKSGRGLLAQQDIEVGDVVVVESPYASTLLPGFLSNHCHHCCELITAVYPCLECSEAMFCNEKCRKAAWDGYHKYECDILASVRKADISLGHLALKMVLQAGYEYIDNYENKYGSESNKDPKLEGFNEDGVYDSTDYRTVYSLVNHTNDRKKEDVLKYCLSAVYLLKCLELTSYFHDDIVTVSRKACVGGHILKHLQMLPCNAHEVSELAVRPSNLPESITLEIGSAIYPVLSLINHSCDPNVVRHSYGDTCVVRAIRNIPKGTEILDNYGVLCALTRCPDRRVKMEHQYFFTCNCLACEDDYPQYTDLPTEVPVFKCDNCQGPIFLPLKGEPTMVPCSACMECHNLTIRVSSLAKSDETFRYAMMDVLTNEKVDINKQVPILESHLQAMDQLILRPWRDYNDCQEVLKQCYALNASHYTID